MTTPVATKWNKSTLENLLNLVIDYRGKTPKKLGGFWSESGIPALSAKNIKEGQIVREDQIRYVDDALYKKWMKEELNESDVLLTSEAPVGEVYFIKKNDPKFCLSQRLFALRANRDLLDPKYLFYYLRSTDGQHELLKRATGTTVGGIRQTALLKAEIEYPDLTEQKKIANALYNYDCLIENNNKRIKVAEDIAKKLYLEWFVNFRFPGNENQKSKIPEGWVECKIDDFAFVHRGKSYTSEELSDVNAVPLVNLKCIKRYGGFRKDGLKNFSGKFKDTQKVSKGDIVMAVTDMTQERMIVARSARIPTIDNGFGVISMDLVKIEPKDGNEKDFLYAFFRWSKFPDEVKNHANGANVLHLNPQRILDYKIIKPDQKLQKKFAQLVSPIFDEINNIQLANENLEKSRDILIPQLVGGNLIMK